MRAPAAGSEILLTTAEVAEALNWRTRRVTRWLIRHDAGVKIGEHWYTTRRLLERAFPEAAEEIWAHCAARIDAPC